MAYQSLYRKYRSQSFGELVGQDHVVRTLQNGISSGRISHAYLFTGPRGTGKTSTARLLAKALCCETGPSAEPCNNCEICVSITDGSCIDLVEMDAASESGVDDVRETIVQVVNYRPAQCRYKVFIIDEVHDLSGKAFDALLKTIEEPPSHIIFILATTEFSKVPSTIRSRCQKFEFHRATLGNLVHRLKDVSESEGISVEPGALMAIARMADGGYRDAMTLLEQAALVADGTITREIVFDQLGMISDDSSDRLLSAIAKGDAGDLLQGLGELTRLGRDPRAIVDSMLHRVSDLTRAFYGVDSGGETDVTQDAASVEMARRLGAENLSAIRSRLASTHQHLRDISLPRLWLEAELLRMAVPSSSTTQTAPTRPAPAKPEVVKEAPKPVEVTPVPVKPVEKAVVAVEDVPVVPTGSPAEQLWAQVLASMPSKAPISFRMGQCIALDLDSERLLVEISQMNHDWVTGQAQRLSFLNEHFKKLSDGNLRLEFKVRANANGNGDVATVELPSEGQKLVEMAREVFGG